MHTTSQQTRPQPLQGIKVLDIATLFAGPMLATILGDFGADVIKIEHPKGDPARGHGHQKDGVPLWWKMVRELPPTTNWKKSWQCLWRHWTKCSSCLVTCRSGCAGWNPHSLDKEIKIARILRSRAFLIWFWEQANFCHSLYRRDPIETYPEDRGTILLSIQNPNGLTSFRITS